MGRRIRAAGAIPMQAWAVPVEEIVVDLRANNRFGTYTEEDCWDIMQDLWDGIGIEYPVLCRSLGDKRIQLVAGYRRYCSVKFWNIYQPPSRAAKLPVIVRDMNEDEAAQANIRGNVRQRPLSTLDMAVGVGDLSQRRIPDIEIAANYGQSIDWVGQTRQLLSLDKATQKRLQSGDITLASALEMAMSTGIPASRAEDALVPRHRPN